jgi:hypothetical protein
MDLRNPEVVRTLAVGKVSTAFVTSFDSKPEESKHWRLPAHDCAILFGGGIER